jgi:putative zinc finger/helix-turn-helix YgiT family protein
MTTPPTKPFPWKCGHCGERAIFREKVYYETEIALDIGELHIIAIPDLIAPKCRNCGRMIFDDPVNRRITNALREQVGLLKPAQIRAGREALGLTQEQLAAKLRIASATVSRWETGAQVQQRALDLLMRLYFGLSEVRSALADEERACTLGEVAA